jgi:hypothetical protein
VAGRFFKEHAMTESKQPVQQPAVEELGLEELQQVGGGVVPGGGGSG